MTEPLIDDYIEEVVQFTRDVIAKAMYHGPRLDDFLGQLSDRILELDDD